jgi:Flp pilus assembly protein TadG
MTSGPRLSPSPRSRRSRRRRTRGGQGLVEFALVAPIFVIGIFLIIDFGRLLYAYSSISSAAREGARILSLKSDQFSDCYAYQQMEKVAQGFVMQADPNSLATNDDPNYPGTDHNPSPNVPLGTAWVYIYPAVSTASPPDASPGCTNANTARSVSSTTRSVAVEIQYHFMPLTPLIGNILPDITLKTISVTQTEY